MQIVIYKADNMNFTVFNDEANYDFFAKHGIRFTNEIENCDLILSRFFFILKNYAKYHGTKKKYLLWTHEPRIDMHLSRVVCANDVPINIMNVYTGDIFTNNYLYTYCLKQKIEPVNFQSFERLKGKKIAVVASYNEQYFSQALENGQNLDLCQLRAEIALYGHALGKVDIYGRGWQNSVSLEDSRFQQSNTEVFWGDRKLDILQQYHFNLCFENSTIDYYCSEKIWHAIMTGCLPIYYGKENAIYEDFPSHSFLDYGDFNHPQELFDYIDRMSIDEYNQRVNLCIQTVNRIINDNCYALALQQSLLNTVSKIQTVTENKRYDQRLVKGGSDQPFLPKYQNVALNKPAQQSSTCKYSKPNDSQGAVSGIKIGRYNFHTDYEVNPWWQVDLERVYEVAEIRIYNRLDSCNERASTLKLFISLDGKKWKSAYENNPTNIFGGIDGNPLKVNLKMKPVRYVRIQLNSIECLHLDQVEVYAK